MDLKAAAHTRNESETNSVVRMVDVQKTYDNGNTAVEGVNLTINEGDFVSFVGPSGCGKSTIFKMVAGLTDITEGYISLLNKEVESEERDSKELAYVFQDATLLPWLNVFKNISLPLKFQNISKKMQKEMVLEVLELVGLEGYEASMPRELSGGMKMRVSIARALVAKPKLLLMDEPFGALDEITRQNLQEELLRIWGSQKMTVLFITHNVFESVYLSNKVAVMTPSPGKIETTMNVPLAYPRVPEIRTDAEFSSLVAAVSEKLKH